MARETLPVALELIGRGQPSLLRNVSFSGAHRRRSAMRTAERVKVIEWIATLAAVALVAAFVAALLP